MNVTATLHRTEHNQGSAEDIHARILTLAAQGLKPRDISALLGLHPQIVLRVLERERECQ